MRVTILVIYLFASFRFKIKLLWILPLTVHIMRTFILIGKNRSISLIILIIKDRSTSRLMITCLIRNYFWFCHWQSKTCLIAKVSFCTQIRLLKLLHLICFITRTNNRIRYSRISSIWTNCSLIYLGFVRLYTSMLIKASLMTKWPELINSRTDIAIQFVNVLSNIFFLIVLSVRENFTTSRALELTLFFD